MLQGRVTQESHNLQRFVFGTEESSRSLALQHVPNLDICFVLYGEPFLVAPPISKQLVGELSACTSVAQSGSAHFIYGALGYSDHVIIRKHHAVQEFLTLDKQQENSHRYPTKYCNPCRTEYCFSAAIITQHHAYAKRAYRSCDQMSITTCIRKAPELIECIKVNGGKMDRGRAQRVSSLIGIVLSYVSFCYHYKLLVVMGFSSMFIF